MAESLPGATAESKVLARLCGTGPRSTPAVRVLRGRPGLGKKLQAIAALNERDAFGRQPLEFDRSHFRAILATVAARRLRFRQARERVPPASDTLATSRLVGINFVFVISSQCCACRCTACARTLSQFFIE